MTTREASKTPIGFTTAGDELSDVFSSLSFDHSADSDIATIFSTDARTFGIRPADSEGKRFGATLLLNKMYSWRGYGAGQQVVGRPDQITLVAADYHDGSALGTLTVGLDRGIPLLVDTLYRDEADALRANGGQLCEMIKFAVDRGVNSKHLLAALFHVAFIYAYHLNHCTDLLIEVTPKHALFYKHLLGFERCGEVRLNPRVNTMGVLLRLDLEYAAEQIRVHGGGGKNSKNMTLYPYAFSEKEERGVVERLKRIEQLPEASRLEEGR